MTLPQPTEVRLLPRSLYCLSSEGESRLVVASYFVWAPFYEAWSPTSARVLRSLAPVETTHPPGIHGTKGAAATGGSAFYASRAERAKYHSRCPRRALPMLSGRGPNLPLRVPLPVGNRARRCRACDRGVACLDRGRSRSWPGCVR